MAWVRDLSTRFHDAALGKALTSTSPKTLRGSIFLALFMTAPDHKGSRHISLRQLANVLSHAGLISRLVNQIDDLDDLFDAMTPQEKLALGSVELGARISEFLDSLEIRETGYIQLSQEIERSGLLAPGEQMSFSNMHALLVLQQAQAQLDYKRNPSAEARKRMLDADMGLAQSTCIHTLEFLKAHPDVGAAVKDGLSLDDAASVYPVVARMAVLLELCDHLEDFIVDMSDELRKGIIAPSWIAGKLQERAQLLDNTGAIYWYLRAFILSRDFKEHNIAIDDLPKPVQEVIQDVEKDYMALAKTLPPYYRHFMMLCWHARKEEGMITQMHPKFGREAVPDEVRFFEVRDTVFE